MCRVMIKLIGDVVCVVEQAVIEKTLVNKDYTQVKLTLNDS